MPLPTVTIFPYLDPGEGFRGWLAIDGTEHRLAAGGFRVQPGVSMEMLARLAEAMTLKQRLLGLAVDGAKAGMDYDPRSPGKHEAMRRFLGFLRPRLAGRLSLGPDMGTTWAEIEGLARAEGITSVKAAVAPAQGLATGDFARRIALLDAVVDGLPLGDRRAGHALAHSALAASGVRDARTRAVVQGFGTLGRGAALSLDRAGAQVVAVADEHACLASPAGLDVTALLAAPHGAPLSKSPPLGALVGRPSLLFEVPADIVVLAACQDAVSVEQASDLDARAVAVGANLGLSRTVERQLYDRGVVVVPDFVGGCGGSASMDALFGPPACPTPTEVLDRVARRMRAVVHRILTLSTREGIPQRTAALALCQMDARRVSGPPYGHHPDAGGDGEAADAHAADADVMAGSGSREGHGHA